MRIHALQTGTVAIKESQRRGVGHGTRRRIHTLLDTTWTQPLPIYAWVVEHPEGVLVVDTGETARAGQAGYFPWWHPYYRFGVREWVKEEEEIGPQLQALGIRPTDVRWLVLTHLHTDHAGGLHHFPNVDILVSRAEYQSAIGFSGRMRGYLSNRWPSWFAPRLIDFAPAKPFGAFPASYPLTQAGDVVLVPTAGHSPGHLSVIVQDGPSSVFLAGDTSYTQQFLLDGVIDGVSEDESQARQTIGCIQRYLQETPTVYLPSHDQDAARRLAEREIVSPATLEVRNS